MAAFAEEQRADWPEKCTSFYMGKEVTENGSYIWGRTEDYSEADRKILEVNEAEVHKPGDMFTTSALLLETALPHYSPLDATAEKAAPKENVIEVKLTIGSKEYEANGVKKASDVALIRENSSALLPLRVIDEAFDLEISWDGANKTAWVTVDGEVVKIAVGQPLSDNMEIAGLFDGRLLVPVYYIEEQFGATVVWDEDRQEISVSK